jgi:hypothetical protein
MAIPPQALLIGANVRFCDGCAFWSVDRWLSGQWSVDNMRPLMADMQTARLGVDHSDARRRTGRKSLVGCADLE